GLVGHGDLAKAHQSHTETAGDQPRNQFAGVGPIAVQRVSCDQNVHEIRSACLFYFGCTVSRRHFAYSQRIAAFLRNCAQGTSWGMFRLRFLPAHPDDEAGSFGGSLRLYRDHGVETSVVCLTPGQAGSYRGNAKSDAELAAIRRQEFLDACQILGISRPIVLNYPDGQLYRQELNRVVYALTLEVRRFRPDVL